MSISEMAIWLCQVEVLTLVKEVATDKIKLSPEEKKVIDCKHSNCQAPGHDSSTAS